MMERWKRLENEKGNGEMVGMYGGEEMMALLHTRRGKIWMLHRGLDGRNLKMLIRQRSI